MRARLGTWGLLAGLVVLREENFLRRTLQGSPHLDPSLQGPQLPILKPTRILPLQMLEEALGFQPGVDP